MEQDEFEFVVVQQLVEFKEEVNADITTAVDTAVETAVNKNAAYEKIVIWAEEGAAMSANFNEYSFGNGAIGNIGITLLENWEIYGFSFHSDAATEGSSLEIQLMNNRKLEPLITLQIDNTHGTVNNFINITNLEDPIKVDEGTVIGFKTGSIVGSISDARCAVWLRRKPGF